jgi:hypothetical protein
MPVLPVRFLYFLFEGLTSIIAEKISKMEEEGPSKWTEEQLAETMLEFSGTPDSLEWS